jgi:hypothetical protein
VLTIREEQIALLTMDLESRFAIRVAGHLKKNFPARCGAQGEDAFLEGVRHCIQRARQWDILAERDICKYAILGLILGPNFDSELPWASEILELVPLQGVQWVLEKLKDRAMASTEAVGDGRNRRP